MVTVRQFAAKAHTAGPEASEAETDAPARAAGAGRAARVNLVTASTMTAPGRARRERLRLGVALVVLWLLGSAMALWHFGVRDRRVFDPEGTIDPAATLAPLRAALGAPSGVVVLAFWDAGCGCSRAGLRHLRELARQYRPRGVRVVLVPGPLVEDPARLLATLAPEIEWLGPATVALPSAPAAAVLDAGGRIQYFGPLANGLLCSGSAAGPVETTLEQVLAGHAEPFIDRLGVACLCAWRAPLSRD